jgi:hypothetical protein
MDAYEELAAFIHAFSDHKSSYDEKVAAGSTVLNRIDSGKKEFGIDGVPPTSVHEVLFSNKSPYYEVNGKNERWNEAVAGKVAKFNEEQYKENLQISRGLLTGDIERKKGQFIFRPTEVEKLKKNKGFDFKKTQKFDSLDRYEMYGYTE